MCIYLLVIYEELPFPVLRQKEWKKMVTAEPNQRSTDSHANPPSAILEEGTGMVTAPCLFLGAPAGLS